MKRVALCAASALLVLNFSVSAPAAAATAQQDRMKTCNKDAGDKKGDERKAFMKECLSAKAAESKSARTAQQDKMATCNKDAKEKQLKGAERKKFMSECLKG